MRGWLITVGFLVGFLALPNLALAQQTDYSAGKTPAQLFSGDCSACHKSPRGLSKGRDPRALTGFLREHYTSKVESAGALAAYLTGNPGPPADARNADPRKRQGAPAEGARAARGEPAGDDTTIAVPEGGPKANAKPADSRATRRAKKPDPAEVAREAAKAAEEAIKAKVNAYATMGDAARPLVTEAAAPPPEAAPAAPAAQIPVPETPASPPPAQNSATEGTPAAETHAPAEEHPAAPPPG
jgi:hypothetical protein